MTSDTPKPPEAPAQDSSSLSAVERAIAFGIDVTLLIENLRLTPTERLRRGEKFLVSVIAFQEEVRRAKQLRKDK